MQPSTGEAGTALEARGQPSWLEDCAVSPENMSAHAQTAESGKNVQVGAIGRPRTDMLRGTWSGMTESSVAGCEMTMSKEGVWQQQMA